MLTGCFCLIFAVSSVFGQSILEKKLDFNISNLPLQEALNRLSTAAEVPIVFSGSLANENLKVSFSAKNQTLFSILNTLLKNKDIGYRELNGQIILFPIERPKQFFTLSGFVEDAGSGERLIGANVVNQKNFAGTATNVYGFFSLTLEAGEVELAVSYLGYQAHRSVLTLDQDIFLNIKLEASLTLEEIVVIGKDSQKLVNIHEPIGNTEVNLTHLASMPSFVGEADVMRMMDMLPGVQSGADGIGGLHVRGGTPDQNLILLDGVPVYNVNHMLGMFSMFNEGAIQKATLQKGGFDAQQGGRLSSVVDIRMKEGNRNEYHGGLSLGLLSSRVNVEGPIAKGKSSFMLAGRRTYWDWLWALVFSTEEPVDFDAPGEFNYHFYDWNGKVNFTLSEKDKIYCSIFNGGDNFKMSSFEVNDFSGDTSAFQAKVNWRNWVAALRWNRIISPKLFMNNTLTYSRFIFNFLNFDYQYSGASQTESVDFISNSSNIQDFSVRSDWDYFYSPRHHITFGGSLTYHFFKTLSAENSDFAGLIPPDVRKYDPDYYAGFFGPATTRAIELNMYVEDRYKPLPKLEISGGLYLATFGVRSKTYWSAQPRLNIVYELTKNLTWQASGSAMAQFLHLVTGSNISLPSDIWAPATARIGPQKSWQVSTGWQYYLPRLFKISLETYYKKMNGLLNFIPRNGNPISSGLQTWEDQVTSGEGKSYGLEFLLERSEGKTNGLISYTLSRSFRRFDQINRGETFPFHYDRLHFIKTAVVHRFSKKFQLSFNWIFGTGNPYTIRTGAFKYLPTGQDVILYAPKNSVRLPDYHRADLGFVFPKEKSWGVRTWVISLYNVYNRQNPFYIYQDNNSFDNTSRTLQVSLFPILPAFSYGLQF